MIYRWKHRIHPFQQSGNHERMEMKGLDQLLLTMYVFLFPRIGSDEISTFIYINGGSLGIARATISERCKELKITRKRASLESYAAYTPINKQRTHLFFTIGPPVGIHGIPFFV